MVIVNGKKAKALVITGCTTVLFTTGVADSCRWASNIRVVDSREVKIMVRNILLWLGIDMILGLDAIDQLGGATIAKGQVKFGNQSITKMAWGANSNDTIQLTEPKPSQIDFQAHFDGDKLIVEWWWTVGPHLCWQVRLAAMRAHWGEIRVEFCEGSWEVDWWRDSDIVVREGWRNTVARGSGSP